MTKPPDSEKHNASDKEKRAEFQKRIGKRVKSLRERKKLTQEELAAKADINDKYLYDIESGNKCMSSWVLSKVAEALKQDTDQILSDSSETYKSDEVDSSS